MCHLALEAQADTANIIAIQNFTEILCKSASMWLMDQIPNKASLSASMA